MVPDSGPRGGGAFAARWFRLALLAAATAFLVVQLQRLPPDVDLRRAGGAAMELAAAKIEPFRQRLRRGWWRWLGEADGRNPRTRPPEGPRIQVATLEIVFHHRLAAGFINVWVDDHLVMTETLEVGVLGLLFGKTLEREMPVLPGERRVEIQVAGMTLQVDARETLDVDFGAGDRRRVLVELEPGYRRLDVRLAALAPAAGR